MSDLGADVLFVLPKHIDTDHTAHVTLLSPAAPARPADTDAAQSNGRDTLALASDGSPQSVGEPSLDDIEHVSFKQIPTWLQSPYQTPKQLAERPELVEQERRLRAAIENAGGQASAEDLARLAEALPGRIPPPPPAKDADAVDYGSDIMTEVHRYAQIAMQLTLGERFDVIHAHDWMTYPAGLAIAGLTGRPLVVHVHSTEFDRAGENIDSRIYEIERRGMHGAIEVVCVSHLTRKICEHRYAVESDKTHVVYNGIEMEDEGPVEPPATIQRGDKIVLFLGRITLQKGPEYFIDAARKVLEKYENVKFVMAGSGDMAVRIITLAAEMGIGHKVLFTGFLRGRDVERVYRMASVYVMPSVSEPFGIAPLEAIRNDVPVIISKNSGVAEVLNHALKVDFWDTAEMANKIIAVLKHPPLSRTLREGADMEVRQLTWEGAAEKCIDVYDRAIRKIKGEPEPAGPDPLALLR
jgi:glycosyltransferase involved in cell wall biosynthesis